ncbi:MAG: carbon storage regulator [Planctomycetales bacterium]
MMVLTRKVQESVVVGEEDSFDGLLKITVLEIHGNRVKLGIEADASIPIHRSEIWERLQDARMIARTEGVCHPIDELAMPVA